MAADDWLSAMIRNQYAAPGGANLAPGGSVMGYPAASGQGPNMGYPAAGMGAPQQSAGSPGGQVPNIPISPQIASQIGGGGAQQQPDMWSLIRAKLASLGSSIGEGGVNPSGQADPTGAYPQGGGIGQGQLLGGGPAQAAPAPGAPFVQPQHPSSIPFVPSWSQGAPADPSIYGTPQGQPSATPRPAGALAANPPLPPTRPAAAPAASPGPPTGRRGSDGRFTTVQYQANPGRTQPIYTALNLFGRG